MSVWDETTGITGAQVGARSADRFERSQPFLVVLSGLHFGQMFPLNGDVRQVIGRGRDCDIRIVDVGISRRHVAVGPGEDGRVWIEDLGSRNGTFCNGKQIKRRPLNDGDKIQLGQSTMLRFTYQDEYDQSFQQLMYDSALRDGLTRVFNKRYFSERLEAEFHFAQRHKTPLSLILIDLDHFKRINDLHGHVAGDHVLASFADSVQRSVRNEDVFARFGGEEFALITRSISPADAVRFAERLRLMVENMVLEYKGHRIPLTMSVGIAALPDIEASNRIELIGAADAALYRAKRTGRNRVEVFDPRLDQHTLGERRRDQKIEETGH